MPVNHFFSKVVGVTRKNEDGTKRQAILRQCQPMERLVLDHEENNPADPNAVAVYRSNGRQIGYLNRELAKEIVTRSKRGYQYAVFAKEVTGGDPGESYGLNLFILVAEPGTPSEEVQEYVNDLGLNDEKSGNAGCLAGLTAVFGVILLIFMCV